MSSEPPTTTVEAQSQEPAKPERKEVGAALVGTWGIILLTVYLVAFSILLLYSLMQFWPPRCETPAPTQSGLSAQCVSPATFGRWTFLISDEVRLLLLVAMAGALGSLVHALRSVYWYVGNRELVRSWLVKYILLPFVGATIALIFYFVIRGGFFSPQATVQQTSPYSFVALASLVGLFSEQAVLKLKDVFETLFTKPKAGADSKPQESGGGALPTGKPGPGISPQPEDEPKPETGSQVKPNRGDISRKAR